MTVLTLDLMRFLPAWMRDDQTAQGLAYAAEKQLKAVALEICKAQIYTGIDTLPEAVLDELARQFSVVEYNSAYFVETKRQIIKSCIATHRRRGTVAAIEKVVSDVFGDGWVEEWFEYSGNPYKFKVHTSNVSAGDTELAEFERLVTSTQNVRSHLETVIVETVVQMDVLYGAYQHTTDFIYI